jgi:hypothetical protein
MKNLISKLLATTVILSMMLMSTSPVLAEDGTTPAPTELAPTEGPIGSMDVPTELAPTEEATPPAPTDVPTELAPTDGIAGFGLMMAASETDNENQRGTTLSADKTAAGHLKRVWNWKIDKSVTPDTWDLFRGDSGTSEYTITVTKIDFTDTVYVNGSICVTNGGDFDTENLTIVDQVQYKDGPGPFQDLPGATQTIFPSELAAGESGCYDYSIAFTPVEGALYRNVAHVTITNHAGWVPGGQNCPGPNVCPFGPNPKADFSVPVPGAPDQVINPEIDVTDTNGGHWHFGDSGEVKYPKTFTCDADQGKHDNTATIVQTEQFDDASVQVNCYALDPSKTVVTSFDRQYNWEITKSANYSNLTLEKDQTFEVKYEVVVDVSGYGDSNWAVSGDIEFSNFGNPIDATINSVKDIVSPDIAAPVDCGVTFPYTLPAGETLHCTYSTALPNADARDNTATATLQNFDYDKDKVGTPDGTTDYSSDPVKVDFGAAIMTEYDKCADVTDSYAGYLGHPCFPNVPVTYHYSRTVGGYSVCGPYKVNNTATVTPVDSQLPESDSWTVDILVPCNGCTLTLGYWKTHAGFGPQRDMLSQYLPILLGTPGGTKSVQVTNAGQAVTLLSMSGDASNGINKLYAQLLAAKLNIAAGASGSAVASTISAADNFLATYNSASWSGLTKSQKNNVLKWMTALDNYNNGLTGPGYCSQ